MSYHFEHQEAREQSHSKQIEPPFVDVSLPRCGDSPRDTFSHFYSPKRVLLNSEIENFLAIVDRGVNFACHFEPSININRSRVMLVKPPLQLEHQDYFGVIYYVSTLFEGKYRSLLPDFSEFAQSGYSAKAPVKVSNEPLPIVISAPVNSPSDVDSFIINPIFSLHSFTRALNHLIHTVNHSRLSLIPENCEQIRFSPFLPGLSSLAEQHIMRTFMLSEQEYRGAMNAQDLTVNIGSISKNKRGATVTMEASYSNAHCSTDFSSHTYYFEFLITRTRWGTPEWRPFGQPIPIEEI